MAVLSREERRELEEAKRRTSLQKLTEELLFKVLVYTLLTFGAIIFIAPFGWMVTASFQHIGDIFEYPPNWIPQNPTLENYTTFFSGPNVPRLFMNSAIVAITVTGLQLFFNALAAYTFAKRRFPGRDFLFMVMLGTMMIPHHVTLIPTYLILQHMPLFGGNDIFGQGGHGWLDSYWGLIVPGIVSAFGIFLLRQYMKGIPDDLLDAARIDGANEFRIFWQIVLPLSRPALAALGIFTFTYVWDDFFWPLIVVSSEQMRTLPLGLALFVVKNKTVWNLVMAGSVVATLPVLIVFLLFQRWFIRGIALTGIK